MNLEDIARQAGVSRSTVSRVINNEPYVSSKTRERVQAIIERENFSPNSAARALVTQRTQVIGVIIPTNRQVFSDESAYFPTLLQGMAESIYAREYAMLLWLGEADEDEQRFHNRIFRNRLSDGYIIASASADNPITERLLSMSTPFVQVERPTHHNDAISYVTIDNVHGAESVVEHLLNHGRRRIATITGMLEISDGVDRLEGYKRALSRADVPYDPQLVAEGRFNRRSGYLGMRALLDRHVKPDAVFVASDIMAMGALEALIEAGLKVPDDIALVGFDDAPVSARTTPPLTTMRQPIQQKGARAASILIDLIENPAGGPRQVLLSTQLVIRQSCGAMPNHYG